MVTTSCLKEFNRLRAAYRPVFYPLLAPPKTGQKRKHTGSTQHNKPKPKNPHGAITDSPNKGKQHLGTSKAALTKKIPTKRKRSKPIDDQPAKKAQLGWCWIFVPRAWLSLQISFSGWAMARWLNKDGQILKTISQPMLNALTSQGFLNYPMTFRPLYTTLHLTHHVTIETVSCPPHTYTTLIRQLLHPWMVTQ